MEQDRMRADAALVARGLAASREKAQGLIAAGLATPPPPLPEHHDA